MSEQELLAAYKPGGVLALTTKTLYDAAALPGKDVFVFINVPSAEGTETGSMLDAKMEAFAAALKESEHAIVASLDVMAEGLDDLTPGYSCRLKWFMNWSGRCPAALFPVCLSLVDLFCSLISCVAVFRQQSGSRTTSRTYAHKQRSVLETFWLHPI